MNHLKYLILIAFITFVQYSCTSQKTITQETTTSTSTVTQNSVISPENADLADNLDLEAIASIFAESDDLEDFEKNINDPDIKISNLDLNNDGHVDYLKVVGESEDEIHHIHIQAVYGKDEAQNVAEITVNKEVKTETTTVQVIGDPYIYGPDYIIQPTYAAPPVMFFFLFGGLYNPWVSPYYWGYYPPYYSPWRPVPVNSYHSHIRVSVNVNNSYHHTNVHRNNFTRQNNVTVNKTNNININNNEVNVNRNSTNIKKNEVNVNRNSINSRRNDMSVKQPSSSFQGRNQNSTNYRDFSQKRTRTRGSGRH